MAHPTSQRLKQEPCNFGKYRRCSRQRNTSTLTHEFAPGIPRWPGFPDETRKTIYWYDPPKDGSAAADKRPDTMGSGFFSEVFTHVGQWGTHVDPPAHFIKGLRTVDQIDPKEMVLPLVVIDAHEEVAKDPDFTLSLERVKKWEKRSRPNSRQRFRGDAHGLVEALA
jgi:kynurenine formamidase